MTLLKTIKLTEINPYGQNQDEDFMDPFKLSKGLEFKFSGKHVLLDGVSGTGKTTLLKLIESNFLDILNLKMRNENSNTFVKVFGKYSADIQVRSLVEDSPDTGIIDYVNDNGFPDINDYIDAQDNLGSAQRYAVKTEFDEVIGKLLPFLDDRYKVNSSVLASYLSGFGIDDYYSIHEDFELLDSIFEDTFISLAEEYAKKNKIDPRTLFGSIYMAICPEAGVFDTDSNLTFSMSHTGKYPDNVFSSYERPKDFEGSEGQYLMHVVDELIPKVIKNNTSSIILLDEVSSKIDRKSRRDYEERIMNISNRNNQIICTSHSDTFYERASDHKNWTVIDFDNL